MHSPRNEEIQTPALAPMLPRISLWLAAVALSVSVGLATAVLMDFVHVPWNAEFLPRLTLLGLLPFSVAAFGISVVSLWMNRDRRSVISVVLGALGIFAAAAACLIIVGTAVAAHPV